MADKYSKKERREFLRYSYNKPLTYQKINTPKDSSFLSNLITAISKNLSAAGILFVTNIGKLPDIASLLALNLDYSTTNVCQEIEKRALIVDNKLIGKVVRIEDNEDGTCDVGVAFVTKSDPLLKNIKTIEDLIQ